MWRHHHQIGGRAAAEEPPLQPPLLNEKGKLYRLLDDKIYKLYGLFIRL